MSLMKVFLCAIFLIATCNCAIEEYYANDEPICRSCSNKGQLTNDNCNQEKLKFYNYKLVKSIFNYGKAAIYAFLWNNRFENSEKELFEKIFLETLKEYDNYQYLGNFKSEDFRTAALNLYAKINPNNIAEVKYEDYPSLKCPTPCTYDLITWKTLFGISVVIFVLALITIGIYSIYLRKQYLSLNQRLKSIKYTKVNASEQS